ncbi:MAG: T9SS type A sorting domain-containing protein [Bacteroidia bacterium]|nr:T9SS type A sorting domain-containing protein [Bacteroidia bacterium]
MHKLTHGTLVLLMLLWYPYSYGQYEGGEGDGNDRASAIQIDLQGQSLGTNILYSGGTGDGQDRANTQSWLNGAVSSQLYSGGYGDGQDRTSINAYLDGTDLANLYAGGNGDGQDMMRTQLFLNNQSSSALYSGGSGDGQDFFSTQSFLSGIMLDMLYAGGNGDGQDLAFVQSSIAGIDLAALYSGGNGDGNDKADYLGSAIPFPVTLLSFEAFPENEYVVVQWVTESELNNDFFTVERSIDAALFEGLYEVAGAGTTADIQTYETKDEEPLDGTSFYRLKSTDFDGAFTYSQIVEVNFEAPSAWRLLLYPNPNSGEYINFKLSGIEARESFHLEIIDMQGRKIWENDWQSDAPVLEAGIDLNRRLPEGSYQVRVSSRNEQLSKLIIIR